MNRIVPLWLLLMFASALTPQTQPAPRTAQATSDQLIPVSKRAVAPDFTLLDQEGRQLRLSSYRGTVVLLDFWATWCHGCKLELPWFVQFDQQYRQRGLSVVGVSMDDGGMAVVKPFIAEHKMRYPVVVGNEALGHQYGLESMPMTLLIDREGRIALSHSGVVNRGDFEQNIRQLLKDPSH